MLKKRIIPVLLLKEENMVKGKKFTEFKHTGNPISCAKVYNHQDADELIFLDISARESKNNNLLKIVTEVGKECFMPLTVGGNITTITQIRELLLAGADKVSINSAALVSENFIQKASENFGSQCIVVAIDVKYENNQYIIYSHCGTKKQNISLQEHIKNMETQGAGEILINSIDNDGMMMGYDINLLKLVSSFTTLPIIALGGAGDLKHLVEAFKKVDIAAVACASLFHFGDNNPLRAKSYLKNHDINLKRI